MRIRHWLCAIVVTLGSCQGLAPEPTATSTSSPPEIATATVAPTVAPAPTTLPVIKRKLAPFVVNTGVPFSQVESQTWLATSYAGIDYPLPLNLSQLANPQVIEALTAQQRSQLVRDGFVVMHSQEEQFYTIRESVSRLHGQPYFLSSDAAFHALHLTFDDLLKALEREYLAPTMLSISQATLEELLSYRGELEGTALESELELAAAYLAVAVKLFEPRARLDPSLERAISDQLAQIMAADGKSFSALIEGFEDDYGAYKPVGHYAGDPALENYFRGMNWLGRVHFPLEDLQSSRTPLLITLALRRASAGTQPAFEAWGKIHETLSFLIGPSDDAGPPEFAALMDQVYGDSPSPADLADGELWARFIDHRGELPAPQINSTFVNWLADLEQQAGWRFMGQRFTLDGFIFQNLVFDKVKPRNGERRLLPSGPDIMAALGSAAALKTVEEQGATSFPGYAEQMEAMRQQVQSQAPEQWLGRAYDAWLYAFFPLLAAKGDSYPSYMRTEAWSYKDMNAALGSWAELKHDTILYSKMPEGAGGGGPPCISGPVPGYVEANPLVFYRMSYVAQSIAAGLRLREIASETDEYLGWDTGSLDGLTWWMANLGDRFELLGDIAAKQLAGVPLESSDYAAIQGCLGVTECSAQTAGRLISDQDEDIEPPAVVAAVAGAGAVDQVLEVGTGFIDRIFVVVPIDGRMHVAQGGLFSYYEFSLPRAERLTDQDWRERLQGAEAPSLPAWSAKFVTQGGSPVDWLGFYPGAAFAVSEQGADLNFRQDPGRQGQVLRKLRPWEYLQVIGGPRRVDGLTWWEMNLCGTEINGWTVEQGEWYIREWK